QQIDPAAIWEPHVEQVQVGTAVSLRHECGGRVEHADAIALSFQDPNKRADDVCFVVDDDDVAFASSHEGSDTLNPAPPSSPGITETSPPDSKAFFLAMDRPRPMPCFLNVIVGSNRVADTASLRPGPESCTSISTRSPSPRVLTTTAPAGPAASAAFCRRLVRMPFTMSVAACTWGRSSSSSS